MFDIQSVFKNCNDNRYLHKNNIDIPIEYRNCSLHIALERADIKKDWESFKKLYRVSPEFLKNHLDNTNMILDYNYLDLPKEEIEDLFKL